MESTKKGTREMNNEPVAWQYQWEGHTCWTKMPHEGCIPLYTHPAQELNDGGEPVKNATYWKRQYNEMSALNDRLKSSLYHANEQIKYLEFHPAKTLTDRIAELEKQVGIWEKESMILYGRLILETLLRKANKK